jgi:tetratricopeptide (TPR) repeat protein
MRRAASLVIILVLIFATPLVAGNIEGTVRTGLRGEPVPRATVQLLRERFAVGERQTGSDGRFDFRGLSIGNYAIRVRAEGYQEQEISVILFLPTWREVLEINLSVPDAPVVRAETISASAYNVPNDAKNEYQKGLEEHQRGQCVKAVSRFQKAIAAFEKYGDAHNELGNCFKEMGELSKAEDSFKKAIVYTSTVYPSMNLVDLYAGQKRYAESHEILRKSMAEHPSEGDLYFGLAKLHFDQGQMKEAVVAGLKAHEKKHRMADVHLLLAKVYLSLKDYPEVATQLRFYLEENPKGPMADQVRKTLASLTATTPDRR